ncbi:MAG: M14 family zinc carboxypeptidase, partial [Balneolaceae bacterium]
IIAKAKPIYYLTAGLHSPETGSPEMVMELAYRLAVDNSSNIRNIRKNVIVGISPVTEPDGRDRVVDIYRWRDAHKGVTPNLTYWGHYVAHDNNRDAYGLALDLTNNILDSYLHWKPTVMHDLHESIPFLYVQTGRGPYNPYFDATTVDEWNKLAYNDVDALTRRDMPGVWTWGFFNGWAGNYLVWIANNRNSIGRFYETFGNSIPQTVERHLTKSATSTEWYRMNPPVKKTTWSLRDNINYMETGVLSTLDYTAIHKQEFLENFYRRSKKAIENGQDKTPHAFVIPKSQRRPLATARLINLLRKNGIEVQETYKTVSWNNQKKDKPNKNSDDKSSKQSVKGGAYIIRMDQPYRTLVGTLLDRQDFPDRYNAPYDDVGWTLPYLYQVQSYKVEDPDILKADMQLMNRDVQIEGRINRPNRSVYLLNNTTENQITVFRMQLPDIPMQIAEKSFQANGKDFASGSLVIKAGDLNVAQHESIAQKADELGITVTGVSRAPKVAMHNANVPRIALVHTWIPTPQKAGWWRLAFDKLGIPYNYLSTQDFKTMDPDRYDVIILPETYGNTEDLVHGVSKAGPRIPWEKTALTPNLGRIDQTADQREGMGYDGIANLKQFLEDGGVLITDAGSASIPIDLGFTRHISIKTTRNLETHGSVFKTEMVDSTSPISYGYPDTLGVYFSQRPVFRADTTVGGPDDYMTPDWLKDQRWSEEYPRVIMRFAKNTKSLLLSGMLKGGKELAGAPAVVDVPTGKGHVVMFAPHPFWRWETHASHGLVFNTLLNWDDLRAGWPERPTKKEDEDEN